MKRARPHPEVVLALIAFAAWRSNDLLDAWRHSPLDRLGWLAFLVWAGALAAVACLARRRTGHWHTATYLSTGGLVLSVLGGITSLNTLCYAGLALACSGLALPGPARWIWLGLGVSWMPALSWFLNFLPAPLLIASRVLAAAAAAFVLVRAERQRPPEPPEPPTPSPSSSTPPTPPPAP